MRFWRKRDTRPLQWDGRVIEVDGDIFTAELCRAGDPDVWADFSMAQCGVTVEPGDLLIVRPDSVTVLDLGVWTQEEIDAIELRAHEAYLRLMENVD